jgi:hypothetical protein
VVEQLAGDDVMGLIGIVLGIILFCISSAFTFFMVYADLCIGDGDDYSPAWICGAVLVWISITGTIMCYFGG